MRFVEYVGVKVGLIVGALEGDALGLGVGLPRPYVGVRVGEAVGADEGDALGLGVGEPSVYVGSSVGAIEGEALGRKLGCGVGAPIVTSMRETLVRLSEAGELSVKTVEELNDATVVNASIPPLSHVTELPI